MRSKPPASPPEVPDEFTAVPPGLVPEPLEVAGDTLRAPGISSSGLAGSQKSSQKSSLMGGGLAGRPGSRAVGVPKQGDGYGSVPARSAALAPTDASPPLRKPVNTLAIVPKSTRITSLARKSYNVLLYEAQDQGLDKEVFRTPLERIVKGVDFDSNDHALIKKHLRAMVSTTVEWQSPTTGEGSAWNVSGLLAHARLLKERGQVWVEWSYAVNLKQELLEPTVFARLKLEIISQLRSHAGIALYEICTRYKDIGRTARQHWRWWQPVLSGQPVTERSTRLEYRIFKRDTLKPAIAEVSTVTDLEVEMVEYKEGRFISEIQFLIRPKRQSALPLKTSPEPVDLSLVQFALSLGIDEDKAEELQHEFGATALRGGLETLAVRQKHEFPAPVRDPYRYLRSLMPDAAPAPSPAPQAGSAGRPARLAQRDNVLAPVDVLPVHRPAVGAVSGPVPWPESELESGAPGGLGHGAVVAAEPQALFLSPGAVTNASTGVATGVALGSGKDAAGGTPFGVAKSAPHQAPHPAPHPAPNSTLAPAPLPAAGSSQGAEAGAGSPGRAPGPPAEPRELQLRRQARWAEEWLRRRREQLRQEIAALPTATQADWMARLLASMEARKVHPSLHKRLQSHGWQHPLVLQEMLRFYAHEQHGAGWDQPSSAQLLSVAAEMGDAG